MYKSLALEWIEEMYSSGEIPPLDEREKDKLAERYAVRIEEIIEQEARALLIRMGKGEEYERMQMFDGQYLNKYLNQTIPGFFDFKREALQKAKVIILGNPLS